jgi:hypothetical protein
MKKFKVSLMALALTLGVAGAFATTSKHHKRFDNPNWQTSNADGTIKRVDQGGSYHADLSVEDAQSAFGCAGSGDDCALTVASQDTPLSSGATYINKN